MSNYSLPIVSVVIPMYNVEKYIKRCLESVLTQQFRNFEVICVDDGCKDDTLNIVKQFSDDRIRIIKQENRGLSGARNSGIFAASGLYVALLDADDFWAAEKLTMHVNHLNQNQHIDVSYCPSIFVDEDNNELGIGQFPKLTNITFEQVLCRNPIGNGSVPVFRKSALIKQAYDLPGENRQQIFNESLRQSEDIELWVRIAASKDNCFEGIDTPLTYYRINEGGLSANLIKQYESWHRAIAALQTSTNKISDSVFSLAKAYQLRYLARRAIQLGSALSAIKLIHQALICNPRIILEETERTSITYACAFLTLMPAFMYKPLESFAMKLAATKIKRA